MAQVPVVRRGRILARSDVYRRSLAASLKSIISTLSTQKAHTLRRLRLRGALLHDYFLYDWHTPGAAQGLHGLTHPKAALKNAREDFDLTATEEDIILHHMFPLTPCPPASREGWLVCLADKYCALKETFHPFLPRRLRKAERKGPA